MGFWAVDSVWRSLSLEGPSVAGRGGLRGPWVEGEKSGDRSQEAVWRMEGVHSGGRKKAKKCFHGPLAVGCGEALGWSQRQWGMGDGVGREKGRRRVDFASKAQVAAWPSPLWRQTVPLQYADNLNYYKAMLQVYSSHGCH